ncbi:MAG: ABC transporter ATP-binding protein [Chloroflexota bacterium]|nr:ABC transporter ATP-binding protein [Chloroflexota bacterium]
MSQQSESLSSDLVPNLRDAATVKPLAGLWRLMRGYRLLFLVAALSLGIAVIARTGSYLVIRYFVDTFLADPSESRVLLLIAGGFVALAAVQGGFSFVAGSLAAKSAEAIAQRVRNYLLNHIQHLPFSFHDAIQTGEMVQRVTSDVDAIRRFFAIEIISSARIIFLFVVNLIAIMALNTQLALLSVIVIPLVLAVSVYFFRLVSRAYENYQEQEAVLTTALQENLTGVRVVKAFARQDFEEAKFESANMDKYRLGKRLLLMHSLYWPISDVMCGVQMLAGFLIAALMAINGTISVGTFIAYNGMLQLVIWPMRNLGRLVVDMSRGLVSFQRVAGVIRQEEEIMVQDDGVEPEHLRGEIVFKNVGFAYPSDQSDKPVLEKPFSSNGAGRVNGVAPNNGVSGQDATFSANGHGDGAEDGHHVAVALQDISFHVKPGQRVALLGATGAGKTSLINLLPRFYDYTSGQILLDGVELKQYPRRFLRRHIGIVEQEPFLFSRTVRENIVYGVGHDVPQEQIEAAARAAAIHDVILTKLPDGYDTLVGERGTTLSGGQKQRVAIARTLLKDPRILILDDSTSSVDTETEAAIRQALETLMENRTTFIIAHRIQSVMNADLILVMNKGRIIQAGKHDDLVNQDGMYRRIFLAQTRIEDELQKELGSV